MKGITLSLACLAAVLVSGCTVHQTEAPGLTGPSEFAVAVNMAASPDTLFQGGQQQAALSVQARDINGAPKANQAFRLSTVVSGVPIPYGTLSSQTVVTGADGRASAIYTMPVFSSYDAGTPARQVSVVATPIGTDYTGAVSHSVELLVVPPPVPQGATGNPTAALLMTPAAPKVGQLVTFDATLSMAEVGHSIVYYYWYFGDGLINEEHGSDASHVFAAAGTYTIVLGVQDETGRIGNTYKTIVVTN